MLSISSITARQPAPGSADRFGDPPGRPAPADPDGAVAARRRRNEVLFYRLCALPALAVTLLVAAVPLGLLIVQSVRAQETGDWTLRYYVRSLGNRFFTHTLLTTIAIALGVTAVSVVLAFPLAFLLARKSRLRTLLMPVVTVPRMLPFVVVGYAMILLLAPITGVVNRALLQLGVLHHPLFILFSWPGQALAFVYSAIVVAAGILTGVLIAVDPELEDAAVSLGATRLRSFLSVTLPLSIPGVIAASALIFATVVTAYAIPVMLGGRVPYMISIVIATNLLTLQETHLAFAQAVLVSLLAVGVTVAAQLVLSRFGRR
ncbi:MAG TPA: ABC transporter permease [Acetobacteraceae bacterium]|jgi:ABC-type spermidine/putrescine transport system permease subunit I|nr:ABC transporter permease [Acetobacteraceae bacterium]